MPVTPGGWARWGTIPAETVSLLKSEGNPVINRLNIRENSFRTANAHTHTGFPLLLRLLLLD